MQEQHQTEPIFQLDYPPILSNEELYRSVASTSTHTNLLNDERIDELANLTNHISTNNEDDDEYDDEEDDETPNPVVKQYTLDEFKVDVRTWIELDDSIKSLQIAIKERRMAKSQLTDRITDFMYANEIEDLITKNGRIRYKTNYVRAPLSHTDIKERIRNFFDSNNSVANDLTSVVFGARGRFEKTSLRRMKLTSTQM